MADQYAFWARGNRTNDLASYAAEMDALYGRRASERLLQAFHMQEGDITFTMVEGDDWRDYLLRKPDWAQFLEGGLFPGTDGSIIRHTPGTGLSGQ